jgi:hypothetical protein
VRILPHHEKYRSMKDKLTTPHRKENGPLREPIESPQRMEFPIWALGDLIKRKRSVRQVMRSLKTPENPKE